MGREVADGPSCSSTAWTEGRTEDLAAGWITISSVLLEGAGAVVIWQAG